MESNLVDSIYFENNDLEILLSTVVDSTKNQPPEKQETQEPRESSLFDESNINQSSADLNHLIPVDFPDCNIQTSFYFEATRDNLKQNTSKVLQELRACDWNNPLRDMIYKARSLETLVESTYNFSKKLKPQMTEEICYLRKIICSWRRVAGDGNCFYRSAIFAWWEHLIFNSRTDILKIICADLSIKFTDNYPKTHRLQWGTKKTLTGLETKVVIAIIDIIIAQLSDRTIDNKEKRIKAAYATLLKAFNFSKMFDTTMIFYLRYLLYEFILDNEDKIFSKDFPVWLGNLLPSQYETRDGNFLFDKYFTEDWLRFYTYAEKLAIYLTPFVWKVNWKVLLYDYGPNCDIQTKFFSSFWQNKETICVLYRKAHYDICYTEDYILQYLSYFQLFQDLSKGSIVDQAEVNRWFAVITARQIMDNNEITSKIYNRQKMWKDGNQNKIGTVNAENEIADKWRRMQEMMSDYGTCNECNRWIPNSEEKKDSIVRLPCGCEFHSCPGSCQENYLDKIYKYVRQGLLTEGNYYVCKKCQQIYSRTQIMEWSELFENKFANSQLKGVWAKELLDWFERICMGCGKDFQGTVNESKSTIICKYPVVSSIVGRSKFEHVLCKVCKSKQIGNCYICQCYHFRVAKSRK